MGGQNLLKLNWLPGICLLSHRSFRRGLPSALPTGSKLDASYARKIPSTTFLLASLEIGAVAQTILVLDVLPFEETVRIPPGIPPLPGIPSEATSALLATNIAFPVPSIFQARKHSFSPQLNNMGPALPSQNTGEQC